MSLPYSLYRAKRPMYKGLEARERGRSSLPCLRPFVHRLSDPVTGVREGHFDYFEYRNGTRQSWGLAPAVYTGASPRDYQETSPQYLLSVIR